MRYHYLVGLLIVASLALVGLAFTQQLAGLSYAQQPGPPFRRGDDESGRAFSVRPRWEYKALERSQVEKLAAESREQDRFTDGLNKLGSDGWEVVTVEAVAAPGRGSMYLFKRQAGRSFPGGRGGGQPAAPGVDTPARPGARADAKPDEFHVYTLKHAKAADLAKILSQLLQGRDSRELRLVADPRTNSVLARGETKQLEEVEALLQRLDAPADQ